MHHEIFTHLFKRLQCRGMLKHFEEVLQTNPFNSDALEGLKRLLELELNYREARSFEYRLKLAKLPQIKSLESFDFSEVPLRLEQLQKLAECEFIREKTNLLFIGDSGSGKTHLALSLAYAALTQDYRIKFYTFHELSSHLLKAKMHRYEVNLIEHLERFQLLVIDEMGYLPMESQAGSLLFQLFSRLYERTPIILTTHLKFDEWGSLFGNPKATKAMIDRFTHHCVVLDTGQDSWRLKQAVKKVSASKN